MENASPLLIITANSLFYRTLAKHLDTPCRQAALKDKIDTAQTQGLLLIPESTSEINVMNKLHETTGLPAIMLLPEGSHRAEPACASLKRPVNLLKLQERISHLLRQSRRLLWPDLGSFDPARMMLLSADGAETTLTEKEATLLNYLSSCAVPATREALLENVWRYHPETETHTLETHLYRLRQKLKEVFGNQLQIASDDRGYRLIIE